MTRALLKPAFVNPAVVAALRPLIAGPIRAALIPGAIDAAAAAELRRRLAPRLERFELAHRGRYAQARCLDRPLQRFAAELFEVAAGEARGRLLRLRRGDYSLYQDDALTRLPAGLEIVADLSAGTVADAATVYRAGPGRELIVPQQPGLVAVIQRTPEVYRYEEYLTHRAGRAEVFRLRLQLAYA